MASYIDELRDNVIRNIATYADDSSFYSKCERAFDLWQKLELGFELVSNQRDTVDWGRTWFVDFNTGKHQLVSFDRSHNSVAIDVNPDEFLLAEK